MKEEQRNQLRQQLEEERDRLSRKQTRNKNDGMEVGMNDSIGELSGYDNHPADIGTELFERGKDLALNEEDEQRLKDVQDALDRMDTGKYGLCQTCGKEIPFERLEAVPETSYCVEHQPDSHLSNRRPVEEKVLQPPFGQFSNDHKDKNFYDSEDAWQDVERYGTSNPPDYFREGRSYNDLVVDNDEPRGYAEDVENMAIVDIHGRPDDPLLEFTRNDAYRRKEEEEWET
ncbi:yteA family sporulation protein [Kroppenstedtia pulmonis]|uniref:YteA family sporulation protein n=1 Tax=Kroppenstedtia pulmonis TaxID=1380685 RepID=A0A7D3XS30_9BACL|nr:TraR/DksA C4-type zinc finger protein [Kroppenstedtia pulmonis]QKG84748.1 yteA family sporulation protein [Kroppenstedtia pulmonis]